jgi:hypothetical protein
MKKTILILLFLSPCLTLFGQDMRDRIPENSVMAFYLRSIALLIFFSLAGYFIIIVIQQFINYRLRKKIIEHGTAESLAKQLLSPGNKYFKREAVKWILLTGGLAAGIAIAGIIRPYGFHSLAIILAGLVAGLFFYYQYVKRAE